MVAKPRPRKQAASPLRQRLVVIVAIEGTQILDVAGPAEVFAQANYFSQQTAAAGDSPPYRVDCRSVCRGPIASSCGLTLDLKPFDADGAPIDTLILAGGTEEGLRKAAANEAFVHWLSAQSTAVRRLASVCTGAFLLGYLGVLEGRRATTHWRSCDLLQSMFTGIHVDPDAIFAKDGKVYTSAGITAGIDLSLSLVEEDLGRAVASEIARNLVLYLRRPGGQTQFSAALQTQVQPSNQLQEVLDWMVANLNQDLTVPQLAKRAGMSERNFARIFRNETGETPAKFVTRLRLDQIRLLLIDTEWPLERIASRCGFRSADVMRRAFLQAFGLAPSDYRARFGKPTTDFVHNAIATNLPEIA